MNSQTKILTKSKTTCSKLLLLLLLLMVSSNVFASTTWYVDGLHGNDSNNCKSPSTSCKTIHHAIALAHSGDSIMVAAATYTEHLTIGISLNVIGSGASTTIIDAGGAATVVTIPNTGTSVILSRMTIRNGQAVDGGGVYNSGNLIITSTTISGNSAFGIAFSGPGGGGVYNVGTLTIYNSTVSDNLARPGPMCHLDCFRSGSGGGIYNGGTLTINKSTVSGNLAGGVCYFLFNPPPPHPRCIGGSGGGISSGGTLTISNSTISQNAASRGCFLFFHCYGGSDGGGVSSGGTLTISNSTISGNSTYQGGGIAGLATLQNSIVAYNTGGNCSGTMTSNGYNMSSDGTCGFSKKGDWNSTDPMLGLLLNNGGPTQTMALKTGSPAIDAGNPSGCRDSKGNLLTTDQRGQPRPDSEDKTKTGCDIGAFEKQQSD